MHYTILSEDRRDDGTTFTIFMIDMYYIKYVYLYIIIQYIFMRSVLALYTGMLAVKYRWCHVCLARRVRRSVCREDAFTGVVISRSRSSSPCTKVLKCGPFSTIERQLYRSFFFFFIYI